MTAGLDAWVAAGALAPVDVHLARRLGRLASETRDGVLVAAALASRALQMGHVCLPLDAADVAQLAGAEHELPTLPEPAAWRAELASSPLVGGPDARTPLVLDGDRLYLRRYFEYEQALARAIRARLEPVPVHGDTLAAGLARLFPTGATGEPDWQRVAAEAAVTRRFCVITGGPGTGKTHTASHVIALLLEDAAARGLPVPRIAALAPTGKAANRLQQAIGRPANTVHRALEASADGARYGRGPERRLEADVVLVDEASMVDLGLMVRLVQALPDDARLILLGDRDQLASVEAGAVLGDICAGAVPDRAWPTGSAMGDAVVMLTRSRRFDSAGAVGRLARAVQRGDADAALAALADGGSDVQRVDPAANGGLPEGVLHEARQKYETLLDEENALEAHRILASYRILCAHRRGPGGVDGVNETITAMFPAARGGGTYAGQPILVTRNDPEARLSNGDTGVMQHRGDRLVATFLEGEGATATVRELSPAMLPAHEPVYAMSVHKSQGSELEHVVVVLPRDPSPVVTRELLYTAITRAVKRVTVVATEAAVRSACETRVRRASGLADALWRR